MRGSAQGLVLGGSLFIIVWGIVLLGIFWALGKKDFFWGVGSGSLVAGLELAGTGYLLSRLFQSSSRKRWALFLAGKSFIIYGLVALALLHFHLNIIGFLAGFSGLVVVLFFAGVWLGKEVKE